LLQPWLLRPAALLAGKMIQPEERVPVPFRPPSLNQHSKLAEAASGGCWATAAHVSRYPSA
jgi:hypothetical protein